MLRFKHLNKTGWRCWALAPAAAAGGKGIQKPHPCAHVTYLCEECHCWHCAELPFALGLEVALH